MRNCLLRLLIIAACVGALYLLVQQFAHGAEPARALDSPRHPALDKLAVEHATYMARVQRQGHQNWERGRWQEAMRATGCRRAAEICAESWPWQANDSPEKLWAEFVHCWRQSPGHWSVARVKYKWIGTSAVRGRNGVWYACLIAGD